MSSKIDMSFVLGRAAGSADEHRGAGEPGLFRVVVVADLSGRASRRQSEPVAPTFMPQRVDLDSFDRVFARMAPVLRLASPAADAQAEPVLVRLTRFDDFEPDRLLQEQALFARLRALRTRLADPSTFAQAAAELRGADAGRTAGAANEASAKPAEDDSATLERLLGRPSAAAAASTAARPGASGVEAAVDKLVRAAVAEHIAPAAPAAQQPMVEALDRTIGATMRALLRDPQWQAIEGAWHAVDRFVRTVEMDGQVRLDLVDASAADLLDSLIAAEGDAQRMPLATALRAGQRDQGDPPCTLIVALYPFGSGAPELALLAALGTVAAHQGAVLLAGAESELALIDAPPGFETVASPPSDEQARARWSALRNSVLGSRIGLVWPRVLTRLPYGPKTQAVAGFDFDETADAPGRQQLPWRVAALDAASLLASAFVESGWELQPQSAVEIDDLPGYIDRSGDEARLQAVAEFYLSERQAQAVAAAGVMPLVSDRSQPRARLATWRSIGLKDPVLAGRWAAD